MRATSETPGNKTDSSATSKQAIKAQSARYTQWLRPMALLLRHHGPPPSCSFLGCSPLYTFCHSSFSLPWASSCSPTTATTTRQPSRCSCECRGSASSPLMALYEHARSVTITHLPPRSYNDWGRTALPPPLAAGISSTSMAQACVHPSKATGPPHCAGEILCAPDRHFIYFLANSERQSVSCFWACCRNKQTKY